MGQAIHELSQATTVEEILRVTREHVRRSRASLAALPADCRPARLRGAQDIELWADRLNEASRRLCPLSEEQTDLDRMASLFLIASLRLRQVAPAARGRELRAAA